MKWQKGVNDQKVDIATKNTSTEYYTKLYP